MSTQMSIAEASNIFRVSTKTIRRWIEGGKLNAEKENGKWIIDIDGQEDVQYVYPDVQAELIDTLRQQIEDLKAEIEQKNQQITTQGEQLDHLTQLLALSQSSIQQLTEQNRLMIEDKRKLPFWKKLFSR